MIERLTLIWDRLFWEFSPRWMQCKAEQVVDWEMSVCCVRREGHRGRHRAHMGYYFDVPSDIEESQ